LPKSLALDCGNIDSRNILSVLVLHVGNLWKVIKCRSGPEDQCYRLGGGGGCSILPAAQLLNPNIETSIGGASVLCAMFPWKHKLTAGLQSAEPADWGREGASRQLLTYGQLQPAAYQTIKPLLPRICYLKGLCHQFKMGKKWYSWIGLS
jgi:hypothetical protein